MGVSCFGDCSIGGGKEKIGQQFRQLLDTIYILCQNPHTVTIRMLFHATERYSMKSYGYKIAR